MKVQFLGNDSVNNGRSSHARKNGRTVQSVVLCAVRAEAIYRRPGAFRAESWVRGEHLEEQEAVSSFPPFSEDVNMEAKDMVGIRHQATTGEDIENWEDFMCAVVTVIFEVFNSMTLL
jgi:hypothetical protein